MPQTFGQICANRIAEAKRAFSLAGTTLKMSDVAKLIDDTKAELALTHTAKDIPPSPEAVTAYSAGIGYPLDGQAWCDTYAQKGWLVSGKAKMKDWKAAVRNWKANRYGQGTIALLVVKGAQGAKEAKLTLMR